MSRQTSRRTFLKTAAAGSAVVTGYGEARPADAPRRVDYPDELPKRLPKGLEYILTVRNMMRSVLAEERNALSRAADICAESVAAGRTVYYSDRGHNESQCILETMPGKPSFVKAAPDRAEQELVAQGDVIISVRTDQCIAAKERGVRVIGIQMPFQPQKRQGQGIANVTYTGPYMDDVCDVTIWDRTPYTIGILDFDQLPWKSCAAHGAMDGFILGMILAGTIDRLKARGIPVSAVPGDRYDGAIPGEATGSAGDGPLKDRYAAAVTGGFPVMLAQIERILAAGKALTDAKIAGGRWMLYDRGYAMSIDTSTRGSNPFANLMFGRQEKNFADGDCLIMGSYFSDDPGDIDIARAVKQRAKTTLVTISPHRRPASPRTDVLLHTLADIAIDTGATNGGGGFAVGGVDLPILPHARELVLTINQAIVAGFIENMVIAGKPPTQFYMVHFPCFGEIQEVMNNRVKTFGY